jgi:thiamine pyrophosphate-dependent acetolactate synthase large subunit-like protein
MNVRDAFYEILRSHEITTIFGNPGAVQDGLSSDRPRLIEISQRRIGE